MKTTFKKVACLGLLMALMSGCSMNDDKSVDEKSDEANKTAEKDAKDTKKTGEDTKDTMNDSIDNMMEYFKNEGIAYEDTKQIENMDFAAHEGRSFMHNGKMAYLYRVKSDDENMKKILKEAKDKGKVKVSMDNTEMEYGAKVNGEYLLLYDITADTTNLLNVFPSYQPGSVNNPVGDADSGGNINNQMDKSNKEE